MSETTNAITQAETTEAAVVPEVVEIVKPYTFRKLSSSDIFLMFTIISKLGLKEFKGCLETDGIKNLIQNAMAEEKEKDEDTNSNIISIGAGVFMEIANVLCCNLPKCENEIYQLLSQTSNLTIEEIKAPGNAIMFVEMLVDFLKKEEFPDFIKVVSKLFK